MIPFSGVLQGPSLLMTSSVQAGAAAVGPEAWSVNLGCRIENSFGLCVEGTYNGLKMDQQAAGTRSATMSYVSNS
jgi:hypothetical protein